MDYSEHDACMIVLDITGALICIINDCYRHQPNAMEISSLVEKKNL